MDNICDCGDELKLSFSEKQHDSYTFNWKCARSRCEIEIPYKSEVESCDLVNKDFMPFIEKMNSCSGKERRKYINEIQSQMVEILKHFIECTWGAHYNTMFNEMIKPYLCDPDVLDYVLRSNTVDANKGGAFLGRRGAKMFPMLYIYLNEIENKEIKKYVEEEFRENYWASKV